MRTNLMVTCSAQNAGNRISGLQISKFFQGGMPLDPPSYARSFKMLRSDFWLDLTLRNTCILSCTLTIHCSGICSKSKLKVMCIKLVQTTTTRQNKNINFGPPPTTTGKKCKIHTTKFAVAPLNP
jgi:hypothetical protein